MTDAVNEGGNPTYKYYHQGAVRYAAATDPPRSVSSDPAMRGPARSELHSTGSAAPGSLQPQSARCVRARALSAGESVLGGASLPLPPLPPPSSFLP